MLALSLPSREATRRRVVAISSANSRGLVSAVHTGGGARLASATASSAPGASAKVLRAFYFSADDARRDDEAVAAASADVADYDEDDAAMWVQIALTISLTVMFVFSLPWMVLGFLVSVCTLVCMAPRLLRNAKRRREPLGPPEPDNECLWVNYMWMALRLLWKAGGPGCVYFWLCIVLLSMPFAIWFSVCHDDSSLC